MALTQLVYVSARKPSFSIDELVAVVEQSSLNNSRLKITGVLLCCGKNLMQLLEGEEADVTNLYARISEDERHYGVKTLLCKPVAKRLFPEWSMGLADLTSKAVLNAERLMGLVNHVQSAHDTSHYSVEARLLLNDFKRQLQKAA